MGFYPGLLSLSQGLELFLVASFVGGFSWALAGGALNNYILDKVPPDERPAHLALYNLALNAAILIASLGSPPLAGIVGIPGALALSGLLRVLAALFILRWG